MRKSLSTHRQCDWGALEPFGLQLGLDVRESFGWHTFSYSQIFLLEEEYILGTVLLLEREVLQNIHAGCVTQLVECLQSTHAVLDSIPSVTQTRQDVSSLQPQRLGDRSRGP